jgi:MFS family permease
MAPFVQTMHDITVDGAPALSSKVISFWQGFGETAKMIGQVLGGWLADRFGRK